MKATEMRLYYDCDRNFDEDATDMCTSDSGVMVVSNTKDGTVPPWSWYQQKQLEWALVQYPKFAKERWENIAKAVPGKTKVTNHSCMTCDYYRRNIIINM